MRKLIEIYTSGKIRPEDNMKDNIDNLMVLVDELTNHIQNEGLPDPEAEELMTIVDDMFAILKHIQESGADGY